MSTALVPPQREPQHQPATPGRVDVPCDREHLDQLRAPSSDVAVPSNPAALESIASLLAHAWRSRAH